MVWSVSGWPMRLTRACTLSKWHLLWPSWKKQFWRKWGSSWDTPTARATVYFVQAVQLPTATRSIAPGFPLSPRSRYVKYKSRLLLYYYTVTHCQDDIKPYLLLYFLRLRMTGFSFCMTMEFDNTNFCFIRRSVNNNWIIYIYYSI